MLKRCFVRDMVLRDIAVTFDEAACVYMTSYCYEDADRSNEHARRFDDTHGHENIGHFNIAQGLARSIL